MLIAKKLKERNVVEYLLYMWQIEDLLRALKFDMDKVSEQIVEQYSLSERERKDIFEWYESLIDMMRSEGVQENGHIQLNKNIIIQLNDFHAELMKSGKEPGYNAAFYKALPALTILKQKQPCSVITDIELAFNFLYGIMMLNMQKKEISQSTQETQVDITKYLMLLNQYYQLYLKGKLTFEEN